jgi:hypothetical protein
MKTIEEYLNDPRILNDPDMTGALEPIREIHAIRLKIQDEKTRIGEDEYYKKIETTLAQRGITICYDLSRKGKLKPRAAVAP